MKQPRTALSLAQLGVDLLENLRESIYIRINRELYELTIYPYIDALQIALESSLELSGESLMRLPPDVVPGDMLSADGGRP
ncbi:MAG: hypothetical protein IPK73_00650 [Candidatus Obscuribacter sp.]|nr:hypothetical protein [Candidatus Obscuribacter sp.]